MTGSLQVKKQKGKEYFYVVLSYKSKEGTWKTKWIATHLEVSGNKKRAKAMIDPIVKKYAFLEKSGCHFDDRVLMCDYVDYYVGKLQEQVVVGTLEQSTFEGYLPKINHILHYFEKENKKLIDITPKDVLEFVNYELKYGKVNQKTKKREPLAIRSVRSDKSILRSIMTYALVIDNIIQIDPTIGVKVGRKSDQDYSKDEGFMNLEEANDFLKYFKENGGTFYYIALMGVIYGLRRSELLGLKWENIDFKKKTIHIKNVIVRMKTIYEKAPKTPSSKRDFPLLPIVESALLELKKMQEENEKLFGEDYIKNDYVFKWEDGHTYLPNYLTKHFQKLTKQYGREDITLHKLRHTCCSILAIDLEWPIKEVQQWLGHKDMQTTINIYMHAKQKREVHDTKGLENIFKIG